MPAFKDLLTETQIDRVVQYLREFCNEDAWPRGDLNLPRPLVTEKAFPENETVVASSINAHGTPGVSSTVVYERRIGATAMIEAIVPYDFTNNGSDWASAFGDLALGYKQKLLHSLKRGSIFSVGGELIVPTGNSTLGTGGESTVFEAFAAYGQLLPAGGFLQIHTGVELPAHPDDVPRAYYFRTAIGKTFAQERGLGRRWSPMVEVLADRDLVSGSATNWDVVPGNSASNKQADAHSGQRRLPHSSHQHRGPSEAGDVLRAMGLGGWRLERGLVNEARDVQDARSYLPAGFGKRLRADTPPADGSRQRRRQACLSRRIR